MATPILRDRIWHLVWRWRGRQKSVSTKIPHDGKFKNGKPVVPAAVKRELRRLEATLDSGRTLETRSFEDMLALVEKDYRVSGYRSVGPLQSRLKRIRAWFGTALQGREIQDSDLLSYADHRQSEHGAKNNTIRLEFQTILKALGLGGVSPLPTPPKLKRPGPRQGFFDDPKITALVRHLPPYLRWPTRFGYYTGWRSGEVFGLEVRNVDFVTGEIRLWNSKNELARVFPMDVVPGLRDLLMEAIGAGIALAADPIPAITPYVFFRRLKSGRIRAPLSEHRKAWATACRKAGCPGMIFHDLRRSAARNLELAGWPRSLVMEWMGHETESMFHYYRIVSAADQAIVAARLQKLDAGYPGGVGNRLARGGGDDRK